MGENKTVSLNERNYGIDLLRIVAMMMVVMLHVINQGGVLSAAGENTANYKIVWCMRAFVYCAVNCYAMISGYVGVNAKHKYSGIAYLYLQVIFYTVLTTAVFKLYSPGIVNEGDMENAFFPVTQSIYWYFTAYFGMFFFIPFLNKLLQALTAKEAKALLLTTACVFSILPAVFRKDVFGLHWGYSVLWLVSLYLIGGCIKIIGLDKKIKKTPAILIYICSICITVLSAINRRINPSECLLSYTSPTILLSAVGLVIFFAQLRIGRKGKHLIAFFSPLSFGVYLIHTEPHIWANVIGGRFSMLASLSPITCALSVIGVTAVIWLVCSAIDGIRLGIFKLLHVKEILVRIERGLSGQGRGQETETRSLKN